MQSLRHDDTPLPDSPRSAPARAPLGLVEPATPAPGSESHEPALAGSDQATATNAALRALARAARSFLIYDAHNEAIRQFLRDYEACCTAALAHGPVVLEVRPFELVQDTGHGRETVYVQRDRDRSLAFRLYRDGVRRLSIAPEVEWAELLRLLEILSIRYTGVRQHEDDIVTLLWKAGFDHIEMVAVEGFVLAGGEAEDATEGATASAHRRAGPQAEVPPDWDRPLPPHLQGDPQDLRYHAIPEDQKDALRHELSSVQVGPLAVRLCRDMLALVKDPADPTTLADVSGLVDEVRGLLQADGQLAQLLRLAQSVARLRHLDVEATTAALRRFVDHRALGSILHSAARGDGHVPPELEALLTLVPGDHLPAILTAMRTERSAGSRTLAAHLLEREVQRRPQSAVAHVHTVDPEIGGPLLRALGHSSPRDAVEAARTVLHREDHELQGAVLELVRTLSPRALPASTVLGWLTSPSPAVRLAVLRRVAETGVHAQYTCLKRHLESLSGDATEEAGAVGEAMAAVAPDRALEELGEWVRPRRLLDRMRGAAYTGWEVYAGVSGLALLPGEYPETAIRWRMERSGAELRGHCQHALFHRRHAAQSTTGSRVAEGPATWHARVLGHPGELVLTRDMLCFTPSRDWERWLGAAQLDLCLRKVSGAALDSNARLRVSTLADGEWTFSGPGAERVGRALQTHLSRVARTQEE